MNLPGVTAGERCVSTGGRGKTVVVRFSCSGTAFWVDRSEVQGDSLLVGRYRPSSARLPLRCARRRSLPPAGAPRSPLFRSPRCRLPPSASHFSAYRLFTLRLRSPRSCIARLRALQRRRPSRSLAARLVRHSAFRSSLTSTRRLPPVRRPLPQPSPRRIRSQALPSSRTTSARRCRLPRLPKRRQQVHLRIPPPRARRSPRPSTCRRSIRTCSRR